MQIKNGSLFLFRLFGVNVFLHWSWAVVAVIQIYRMRDAATVAAALHADAVVQPVWFYVAQYLCLFAIVIIHEFGHALACKSVGGIADRIILWPLGGVAFVQPPPRPGALLWSIAAGPLVNVVLLPLTFIPVVLTGADLENSFLGQLAVMNLVLLIFNMLPIYPLDGGQIFRALAWFIFGRGTSLVIAAIVGIIGAAGLALLALALGTGGIWLAVMVMFMGMQSYGALRAGLAMRRLDNAPRHLHARCPICNQNPPAGPLWKCPCNTQFDTFATDGHCPACGRVFETTACPNCGKVTPRQLWHAPPGAFPVAAPPQQPTQNPA